LCSDLGLVEKRIRAGVTKQRFNAMEKHWSRWDAFCLAHNVDPYLSTWEDPVPMLQVFGERYQDGRLAPRHKPVKARTVEDGLRSVGQAHARLGGPDPRKDSHGGIDFRIQRQIKAYKKDDAPPKRVKPVPILIVIFIAAQAFGDTRSDKEMAIAYMITIAFFFLLRPGEYTGTLSDDAVFKMQDVGLYIQGCKLDLFSANDAEIKSATSAYYTFTTQKNGNRNKKLVQGLSGDPWCCPVKATVRRVLLHRHHKASLATPIASLYRGNRRTLVKAEDVTEVLRYAMRLEIHRTGIEPLEISARSLRAGGAWPFCTAR
jgi:G:T-mismatch repair DNA endonuclease (very short patch repair protein)